MWQKLIFCFHISCNWICKNVVDTRILMVKEQNDSLCSSIHNFTQSIRSKQVKNNIVKL